MDNNYNQVVNLLQLCQSQQVQQAEKQLKTLAQNNSQQLFTILVAILKDKSLKNDIRSGAASYLNSSISDNLFGFQNVYYGQVMMAVLLDVEIDPYLKRLMERALINVLEQLKEPEITQFRQQIFLMMKNQNLRDTAYLLIGCFCIPESVDIQHVIYLTRVFMPETLSRIILTNTSDCLGFAKEYNEILKLWIVAWDRLNGERNHKDKQQDKNWLEVVKLLTEVVDTENLITIIQGIYSWMAQPSIYICTMKQLYELNILKQQAGQLHCRALQFIDKNCKEVGQQTKTYKITKDKIIKRIINSLIVATNNYNALDQLSCKDFTICLIKVVRFFFCCNPVAFHDDWKQLLKQIVFPFIKSDSDQMQSYEQNPVEFCSLFEDCAQKQTFGIIKTQACKLLEKISDKSQKITQEIFITDFIVNFLADSIINSLNKLDQNPYGIQYVSLNTATVGLSIFSYRLEKHIEKLSQVRANLNKNIVNSMPGYQRACMYMFLSYNYSQIYPNRNQGSYWIQQALHQQAHHTTAYCANDFLENIADQFYSDNFVVELANKISENAQHSIWSAISKLVKTHAARMSEGIMIQLISRIYQRLEKQFTNVENQEIKQTMDIIKLVQIVRVLADQDQYCIQNFNIRDIIWKILLAFDKAKNLEIQSQFIEIILCLVRQENQISDTSKQVLDLVLKQFAKDQYRNQTMYKILNHYIMKSSYEIIPKILKAILTGIMFMHMDLGEQVKKAEKRLINSHFLLLVQNIVAVHGQNLKQDHIIEIGAVVMRFIPYQFDSIDCKVVLARALNTLLLTHMLSNTDVTWNYINLYSQRQLFYNYDLTVLLCCIKMQAFRQKNITILAQMIVIAARCIQIFRKRERADHLIKQQKKKYGKQNRLKIIKYKQFQRILKYMNTPFKLHQSFQKQLTELLDKMKDSNLQVFKNMAQYISFSDTDMICKLCKFTQGSLLNRRVIYVALKPKAPQQVKDEAYEQEMQNSDQDQDLEQIKRKRVNYKKQKKGMNKAEKPVQTNNNTNVME